MRKLLAHDIAFYCPIAPHQYRSPAGRSRTSYLPLFANYVFVAGDEQARYQTLTTGCVANCLPAPNAEQLVRQLHAVSVAIAVGAPLRAESRIPVGTPVRVRSGAFAGVEGVVAQAARQTAALPECRFHSTRRSLAVNDWEVERL